MPGYLAEPSSNAAGVSIIPSGNLSSSNIQSAIYELDSEKADGISVNNSLNTKASINNTTLTGTTVMTTASVANNLTVNGNTLFVDTVNNRVGIGNNSLTSQLHIKQQSGINDAIHVEGYNGGGAKIYRKESDGSIRFDAIQQGFSDIVFSTTPNSGTITERMKVDSSGRVTMPNQPAFHAYGSGTLSMSGTQSYTKINMIGIYNNVGGNYSTATSRFTVPVSGNYYFHGHTTTTTATSTGPVLFLYRNGSQRAELGIIYGLSANDYIELYISNYNSTSFTVDLSRTSLTGFLIG